MDTTPMLTSEGILAGLGANTLTTITVTMMNSESADPESWAHMPKPSVKTIAPTAVPTDCCTCCVPQPRGSSRQRLDELARLLTRMGYDFVSEDGSGPVETVASRTMGPCRSSVGLVLQPLLQEFPTLLTYAFGELGLDALILVAPDPAGLERLASLLRDQLPAEWAGKVGVVTARALHLLLPRNS